MCKSETLKLITVDDSQCEIGNVNVDNNLFDGLWKFDMEYSIARVKMLDIMPLANSSQQRIKQAQNDIGPSGRF